jgi:cytochrome oxidase Cu insertion factor (SCO1/SenC/PrrC family)
MGAKMAPKAPSREHSFDTGPPMKPSRRNLAIGLLALAVLLAGCGRGGADTAPSDVGGPFQLIDQNGARVDEHILQGKWTAVFFGYTFCPDE